jgi:hypothetical protein
MSEPCPTLTTSCRAISGQQSEEHRPSLGRRDHGKRIRIRAAYGTKEFWAEYRVALDGMPLKLKTPKARTLAWAIDRYRISSTWAVLSNATRRQSENIFKAVIKTAGNAKLHDITSDTIKAGRERRAKAPHSAIISSKQCADSSNGRWTRKAAIS